MKTRLLVVGLLINVSIVAQNTYIAHRGASYLAPENTLAAAKLGWELGADAVEIDIHLSADDRVMVIHDYDTKRTSNGKSDLKIAETNADDLRKVEVGSFKSEKYEGEKIPFIEEILDAIPEGKQLVVEIKCGSEVLPALKKAVAESGKIEQLIFIAFDWNTIVDTQKEFPNNKCYYLRMNPLGLYKKIDQSKEAGLAGVNLYHKIINEKVVRKASENGLEVLAWTVDEPEVAKKLNAIGVQKLTTNRPAWLKKQIEK